MRTITQDEFYAAATARFGVDTLKWKFVCPMCGTRQSVQQIITAVRATGEPGDKVDGYIGFSCIGRFTGQGDAGIAAKNRGEAWDKGCNWTLGGLFHMHTLEVVLENGHKRPTFELAEVEPVAA